MFSCRQVSHIFCPSCPQIWSVLHRPGAMHQGTTSLTTEHKQDKGGADRTWKTLGINPSCIKAKLFPLQHQGAIQQEFTTWVLCSTSVQHRSYVVEPQGKPMPRLCASFVPELFHHHHLHTGVNPQLCLGCASENLFSHLLWSHSPIFLSGFLYRCMRRGERWS